MRSHYRFMCVDLCSDVSFVVVVERVGYSEHRMSYFADNYLSADGSIMAFSQIETNFRKITFPVRRLMN